MTLWIQVGKGSMNPKSVDASTIIELNERIADPYTKNGVTTWSFFYTTLAGLSWCTYSSPTGAREGLEDLHNKMRRMNGDKC